MLNILEESYFKYFQNSSNQCCPQCRRTWEEIKESHIVLHQNKEDLLDNPENCSLIPTTHHHTYKQGYSLYHHKLLLQINSWGNQTMIAAIRIPWTISNGTKSSSPSIIAQTIRRTVVQLAGSMNTIQLASALLFNIPKFHRPLLQSVPLNPSLHWQVLSVIQVPW